MSLYSSYDSFYQTHTPPAVLGGVNRSKSAQRDSLGRFMPNNPVARELWELDANHGVAGGLKRSATAKRTKGMFSK